MFPCRLLPIHFLEDILLGFLASTCRKLYTIRTHKIVHNSKARILFYPFFVAYKAPFVITGKKIPKPNMATTRVHFGTIEIIEFPWALGDNPSVSSGAPLTIEWMSQCRTQLDFELFETTRPQRRRGSALLLSKRDRENILLRHRYSIEEIKYGGAKAANFKQQRNDTRQKLKEQRQCNRATEGSSERKGRKLSLSPIRRDVPPPCRLVQRPRPVPVGSSLQGRASSLSPMRTKVKQFRPESLQAGVSILGCR